MLLPEVRPAVNAGRYGFYPSDRKELEDLIREYLASAVVPSGIVPIGLVVPHAGYVYSGRTAAHGYKLLVGRHIERVIIFAPSHYAAFPGASIFPGRAFATPLGEVPVDRLFLKHLIEHSSCFEYYPEAEQREHSLEVQLPFLQYVLRDFELVPVVMYDRSYSNCKRIAQAVLASMEELPRETIIIASSDLYHGPGAHRARQLSAATAEGIASLDPVSFAEAIESGEYHACGSGPIITAMLVCKGVGARRGTVLSLTTSYEVMPRSEDYVVGYTAVAYHE